MCEQYKGRIEAILKGSDLSTITTKTVRRTLESQIGTSLDPIKKEINALIEKTFFDFQQQQQRARDESLLVVSKVPTKVKTAAKKEVTKRDTIKKTTEPVIKKTTKKKKEPKEKKAIDWPIFKVLPPLSNIIHTDLCSRPQAVKKMWEYIKENGLQTEKDKRIINCDANFRELCDGSTTMNAFSLNKFTQKCFESIPKEEQEKYKQILSQKEAKNLAGN